MGVLWWTRDLSRVKMDGLMFHSDKHHHTDLSNVGIFSPLVAAGLRYHRNTLIILCPGAVWWFCNLSVCDYMKICCVRGEFGTCCLRSFNAPACLNTGNANGFLLRILTRVCVYKCCIHVDTCSRRGPFYQCSSWQMCWVFLMSAAILVFVGL